MGSEGVESAAAAIGVADPLRADERREAACWARDTAAAFSELDDSVYSIHRRTSMRPPDIQSRAGVPARRPHRRIGATFEGENYEPA
jgi:hypothetical protein